uniref:Uncharacterized protein n=1 Tax=Setaria italica TaxID=4555 RepID=K4A3N5_SETIT
MKMVPGSSLLHAGVFSFEEQLNSYSHWFWRNSSGSADPDDKA